MFNSEMNRQAQSYAIFQDCGGKDLTASCGLYKTLSRIINPQCRLFCILLLQESI